VRGLSPSRAARGVLPGFGLSTGVTIFYLGLVVILPLSMVAFRASALTWEQAWALVASPRALASYRISFGASLIAAAARFRR